MPLLQNIYQELAYWVHHLVSNRYPRLEMTRCHRKILGRKPDIDHPKSLIEKIYWLQLNTDTSQWSLCTDKYRVREYVKNKGLGEYLNDIYAVWSSPEEINLSILPSQYVLKTNNACEQVMIVNNNAEVDEKYVVWQFNQWMKHPFGASGAELHYLRISPCIIAEKYLEPQQGFYSLIDYKIWCFSGKPFCIFVTYNRKGEQFHTALYDLNWNPMFHYLRTNRNAIFDGKIDIPKPDCLDELVSVATKLSADFPEVRVDMYIVNGRPIFGEMTFSTGFGYFTDEFYQILGDQVSISLEK